MSRKANDGRGRLGGRAVGTKNKPQPTVGEWVDALLSKKRHVIENAVVAPNCENGGASILAALLVVSALNRVTAALNAATGAPSPENGPAEINVVL